MITKAHLLQFSIFLPFLAGVFLLFSGSTLKTRWAQGIAFIAFFSSFLISLYLFKAYQGAEKIAQSYAFTSTFNTGLEAIGIRLHLGINGISLPLYLLAGIVGFCAGLYALLNTSKERLPLYLGLLLLMHAGLMGTFASIDIFFYYFFHELALIPTFIMIGIWGERGKRSIAMELTIYLTLGAMLSLLGLIAIYLTSNLNSFDIITLKGYLSDNPLPVLLQKNLYGVLLFGFGILVSLFPFHTWAPKGYGAAPTSTAMLHAGVLKKFGLYGLIQIASPLLPKGFDHWSLLLVLFALGNVIIIGFVTMAQKNLKQMIGYSSVMHMGYCFLGIATASTIGIGGALMLIFAHGLSVSLMFLMCNMLYERTANLDMNALGGISQKTPVLCAFFLAAILANIGLPGFANFWGEIAIFISLWSFKPWAVFIAALGVIISAVYGLRAVANIFFGQPKKDFLERFQNHTFKDLSFKERFTASILLLALLAVGFWPRLLFEPLQQNLKYEAKSILTSKAFK